MSKKNESKSCYNCRFFAKLEKPYERSDGAVIYGYCFVSGDKDYSPNMGKGYPVFIDGGVCDKHKFPKTEKKEGAYDPVRSMERYLRELGASVPDA